jgi:lipopolysaccharide/colanic/teichoic acid biosynthesis glycosyltransferase
MVVTGRMNSTSGIYGRAGKRILDIVSIVLASPVLLPLLTIVALVVRLRLGAPVLFRQERLGLEGRPFLLTKFRTMTDARDKNRNLLPDSERLTATGRFLRAASLDELPELIDVLRGEMSLVGPRPLYTHYRDRYTPEQFRRHEVKPGITGWAQINGRNLSSWEQRFELDVWYADNYSLLFDLKILVLTLWKVLRQEGISEEGHATKSNFMGTTEIVESKKEHLPY